MNQTPVSDRVHIGIFGKRNSGKSSLINAITAQNIAIVSEVKGTTTDPVYKTMELLPIGPVVIIDTPGLDDVGELGGQRVKSALSVLEKTDIAVLVIDANEGLYDDDTELIEKFKQKAIPYIIAANKSDICINTNKDIPNAIWVSAKTGDNIVKLKEKIANLVPKEEEQRLVGDLIKKGDFVVLVTPIDSAAPKGRLILPQQQVIRDILDSGGICTVVREHELSTALNGLAGKPKMVITDSQVFGFVAEYTPKDVFLTSFSILFARKKGILKIAAKGAKTLETLKDGDTILISEGCTHHRQCDDIGTVKLPRMISQYTKKSLNFEFTSGTGFPDDLSKYALIVHCGGCMLPGRQVKSREKAAEIKNVPMTNYGILIAYMSGILKRSMELFSDIDNQLLIC